MRGIVLPCDSAFIIALMPRGLLSSTATIYTCVYTHVSSALAGTNTVVASKREK